MVAVEATNRGVVDMPWVMLTSSPTVDEVSVHQLRAVDGMVLDVREPAEYAHGHVPGAVNLPQAELAMRLEELPRDRPIRVICQAGFRSLRSAQFLRQSGFERVATVLGGTAAWEEAGFPLSHTQTQAERPRIAESEWTHAGALAYAFADAI
jgi:rhodanese-related sulfurtransferase